mmetsp:Transcript_15605/g.14131  ORF Transcript_15605/g.14131 Transcript_15605/m.14131 type:complete len:114 (-) Transcript_15605:39-380(-)
MAIVKKAPKAPRLHVKGTILGFKRGRRNTYHHTSLIKVDGVNENSASSFFAGKKVAYIYKADKVVKGSKLRVVWGKLTRTHGTNGVFRAKFDKNLNPETIGKSVRVFLYPSRI